MDKEEELCSLVINVLFTVMWRGGNPPKERGSVIASINMLGMIFFCIILLVHNMTLRNLTKIWKMETAEPSQGYLVLSRGPNSAYFVSCH